MSIVPGRNLALVLAFFSLIFPCHTPVTIAADAPSDSEYASEDAVRRADNYLLFQTYSGGWPRNVELGTKEYSAEEQQAFREKYGVRLKPGTQEEDTNIDATLLDRATTDKIEYIARVYVATGKTNAALAKGVERGIIYLLMAEGPKGGYPAFYPSPSFKRYWHKNVLLTEDVAFATVDLLRQVGAGEAPYGWVGESKRAASAKAAVRFRGLLAKIQIRVRRGHAVSVKSKAGVRTGWNEQHDRKSLTPAWGRDVEPRGIAPPTTAMAVRWLMQLSDPSPQEKMAIHTAIAWLHARKVRRIGVDKGPRDHWATCVEIGKNRPIFGDYVGYVPKLGRPINHHFHRWEDVSEESRRDHTWFVPADLKLLEETYSDWCKTHDSLINVLQDDDQDGLVDRWEEKYGLDPTDPSDGTADSDGDGVDNLSEYHANTHPTISILAPDSRFYPNTHVTITTIGGKDTEVRYSSDGSDPGRDTRRYRKPIRINDVLTIKATAFVGNTQLPVETAQFELLGKIHQLPFDGTAAGARIGDLVTTQAVHVMGTDPDKRWGKGRIGGAIQFDGDGGYVSLSSPRLDSHEGAIALWIHPDGEMTGKRFLFHAFRLDRDRIELYAKDGRLAVRMGLSDPAFLGDAIPIKEWTHLALVWKWGAFDIYRDGQHIHHGEYKDFDAKGSLVGLGGYYRDPSQTFLGRIDDVYVYNRTISLGEVRQLNQLGAEKKEAPAEGAPPQE